jgi:hypothetical protein
LGKRAAVWGGYYIHKGLPAQAVLKGLLIVEMPFLGLGSIGRRV